MKTYFTHINLKASTIIVKSILLVLILLSPVFIPLSLVAQIHFSRQFNQGIPEKIYLKDTSVKKRFGLAAAELMLAEAIPWAADQYIRNVDYTNISWQTLSYNLKPGNWSWDGDGFQTNQFGHPYHGSLFFNSFRSNGYNFWQSSIASFAGSYLWETVAENQAPAPNDFINTGFGGIIMGEMTHRLAEKIINNHRTGFRRQVSEVTALIINPVNGLNRIINGKWGKLAPNSAERDSSEIYTEFDAGFRKYEAEKKGNSGLYAHVKFMYGIPFENYKTPFSNILINGEFGKDDSSIVNIVSIYGSLYGWKVKFTRNNRQLILLTANYDYIRNNVFFYSAQSLKANLHSRFQLSRNLVINTTTGGGLVLLAAVPNEHGYKNRYYDYCWGIGLNGGFGIEIFQRLVLNAAYRGGWLKTINGIGSHYFLHAITGEIKFKITNALFVCMESGYFTLRGNFKADNEYRKTYPYTRYSLRYCVNIR